jgi:hypothetical protein
MAVLKKISLIFLLCIFTGISFSQGVPGDDEKIPYLVTFSKQARLTYGDDDFTQIWFFVVPENCKDPVFIRIYDPEVSGKVDESTGGFNSKTSFSVYGGQGAHSAKSAKTNTPTGNYKTGVLLASKTFSAEAEYDDKWYTFGPLNPLEGELQKDNGGYVFKVIVEGLEGDDGNLYKMFLSKNKTTNIPIEGGNSFSYEYSFRLSDQKSNISHLYPFISGNVSAVVINIFDFDDAGIIRTVTVAKKGVIDSAATDGKWSTSRIEIVTEETNTSMDIQLISKKQIRNNNVVVFITNQLKELLPFYTIPIGGVPKYKYKIGVKQGK